MPGTEFEYRQKNAKIAAICESGQLAIQEAKVKFDLAISPGSWLMPLKKVIYREHYRIQQWIKTSDSNYEIRNKLSIIKEKKGSRNRT